MDGGLQLPEPDAAAALAKFEAFLDENPDIGTAWAQDAGDTLVRGGRLDVGAEVHLGRTEIAVRATGDRLILDDTIRATLSGNTAPADLAPRVAAAWMAHSIAQQAGGNIQVSEPDQPFLLFGATLGV